MKVDPYNHRRKYVRWKEKTKDGIPGLTAENSEVIKRFLEDMELGLNVGRGSKKGGRSYARLNNLKQRLVFITRHLEERCDKKSVLDVSEDDLMRFFGAMRTGEVSTRDGRPYKSTADYVNVFKTFWHWHMKVQRKKGRSVLDICVDLDTSYDKPSWVYLSEDDVRRLCDHAKFKYKAIMLFLFDSGIRSPTELVNVRVDDLSEDCTKLRIRDEVSKTFGRVVNLLLCPVLLERYVEEQGLKPGDYLFPISPKVVNRYLRRLGRRVLGDGKSLGGSPYSDLTLYDFRHSSACYWLPRYKSESALKYRFGWKKSSMIHYYTELLGMRDTITEEDLLVGEEKTQLEKKLEQTEGEKKLLEEQLTAMQGQMHEILGVVERLREKVA